MADVKINEPEPYFPPPVTVTITLTEDEAKQMVSLIGGTKDHELQSIYSALSRHFDMTYDNGTYWFGGVSFDWQTRTWNRIGYPKTGGDE